MARLAISLIIASLLVAIASAKVANVYLTTRRDSLPLNLYPLIISHDSATGELDERRDHIVADWAKTQSASLLEQLNCGARAFDYRPKLEKDKQIFAHHGGITIRVPMSESVKVIQQWAKENPGELVVLYLSHFDGDGCADEVAKLLKTLRVKTIRASDSASCADQLRGLTYGKARSMSSQLSGDGGSVLALFDCTEENFDSTINCYGKDFVCYDSWPSDTAHVPFDKLHSYSVNTTANDPTESSANLWMTQTHWQTTAATVTLGTLHRSSLLLDEQRSGLNAWVKQLVEKEELTYLNLLELEDVCDGGKTVFDAIQAVYLSAP